MWQEELGVVAWVGWTWNAGEVFREDVAGPTHVAIHSGAGRNLSVLLLILAAGASTAGAAIIFHPGAISFAGPASGPLPLVLF